MNTNLKRWTFLDTINVVAFIVFVLYIFNLDEQPILTWILIAMFALWLISVISRNIIINKIQNESANDHSLKK